MFLYLAHSQSPASSSSALAPNILPSTYQALVSGTISLSQTALSQLLFLCLWQPFFMCLTAPLHPSPADLIKQLHAHLVLVPLLYLLWWSLPPTSSAKISYFPSMFPELAVCSDLCLALISARPLEPNCLGLNPSSATYYLCFLCSSVSQLVYLSNWNNSRTYLM